MLRNKRLSKVVLVLLLTFLSMHIFILNLYEIEVFNNVGNNFVYLFFYQYRLSLDNISINTLFLLFVVYYFYYHVYDYHDCHKKRTIIFSIILTGITMMGKCYLTATSSIRVIFLSWVQFYKFVILSVGFFITYYNIIKSLSGIANIHFEFKSSFLEKFFNRHPIIITFLFIVMCWLPYIIIFYPGGSTGDTTDSVFQFFHLDFSWSIQTIHLLNKNIYINKHHSVLFTVLLGNFIKIGKYFCSFDFGFFLYIIFQVVLLLIIFVFMIYFMKINRIPFVMILCSILYICFSATIIQYSVTAVKDTLNAGFTLLYVIFLLQIVRNYASVFHHKIMLLLLIITMLLVLMLRNNGIYTILFSFPFLMLIYKNKRKKIIEVLCLVMLIFISYDRILLPSLGVSDGSVKEMLSVPFMQLARVAKYNQEEFTSKEIQQINEVLNFENMIDNYNPDISDGVKNLYQKDSTWNENRQFIKIWYKYFKKHPDIYIESFFNSTYKYFYPLVVSEDIDVSKHYLLDDVFPGKRYFVYEKQSLNAILFLKYLSPFTVYINVTGLIIWLLIFTVIYVIRNKNNKYLIPLCPLMSILLVCLASPVNGCLRYVLPIAFSVPIILSILYFVYREKNK